MSKYRLLLIPFLVFQILGFSKNPIIPNKGANDPHIHLFNGQAYISYVHYKENGEMALIHVDGIGVGEYDANQTNQAEDYFGASEITKKEITNGGYAVGDIENGDFLFFPNIKGLGDKNSIEFKVVKNMLSTIEIRKDTHDGELLGNCKLAGQKSNTSFENVCCNLPKMAGKQNLCLVFKGEGGKILRIDSFRLK